MRTGIRAMIRWNVRLWQMDAVAADAIIGLCRENRGCRDMGRFANGILECLAARAIEYDDRVVICQLYYDRRLVVYAGPPISDRLTYLYTAFRSFKPPAETIEILATNPPSECHAYRIPGMYVLVLAPISHAFSCAVVHKLLWLFYLTNRGTKRAWRLCDDLFLFHHHLYTMCFHAW